LIPKLNSPPKIRIVKFRTLPGMLSIASARSFGLIMFNNLPWSDWSRLRVCRMLRM
jgi:hypothetical protein